MWPRGEAQRRRMAVLKTNVLAALTIVLLHAVFLGIVVVLAGEMQAILAVGWSFAVAGLLAVWWVEPSPVRLLVRMPLAIAGITLCWAFLIVYVPAKFEGNESLAWAAGFGVQSVVVMTALSLARLMRWFWNPQQSPMPISRFGLGALLAWTALIAVWFGAGRAIAVWAGWTIDVVAWEYFLHVQLLGLYNACYVLIVYAALAGRRLVGLRLALAAALAIGLGSSFVPLLTLFLGAGGLEQSTALALATAAVGVLAATLGPLKWSWLQAEKVRADADAGE